MGSSFLSIKKSKPGWIRNWDRLPQGDKSPSMARRSTIAECILLAQPAGQENRCVVIANGAVSDTFSPFVLLPPTFRFALDFPEALGDLAQALAPQSLDCPPQKSRYPSTPLFLESALSIMALSIPAGQDPSLCRPQNRSLAGRMPCPWRCGYSGSSATLCGWWVRRESVV